MSGFQYHKGFSIGSVDAPGIPGRDGLTRRSVLMGGLVVATGMMLAGCDSSGSETSSGDAKETLSRGGTLSASRTNDWPTMDPHLSTAAFVEAAFVCNYLTRYVYNGQTFELKPGLAESWTEPDDKTIVLKLRQGIKFHDGSDFNAAVAKWNVDRMISHPKSMAKQNVAGIASTETTGPYELTLRLKAPNAATLVGLSSAADGTSAMISQAFAEKAGDAGLAKTLIGTGPFKFQEWVTGVRLKLVKNEGYWEKGDDGAALPYFDAVVVQAIPDGAVAALRLRAGDIDIFSDPRGDNIRSLKNDVSVKLMNRTWDCRWFVLSFNSAAGSEFAGEDKKMVRQAIAAGVDANAISKLLDLAAANNQPLPPGSLGYSKAIAEPAFDADTAKAKLAASGFDLKKPIVLDVISRPEDLKVAQVIEQLLRDIGLTVSIRPSEKTAFANLMITGQYSVSLFTTRSRVDPDLTLGVILSKGGTLNYAAWNDPRVTDLLAQGRSTRSVDDRQKAYEKITEICLDEAYYSFPVRLQSAAGFSKRVQNYSPSWSGFAQDGTTLWLKT